MHTRTNAQAAMRRRLLESRDADLMSDPDGNG
jgi:hypothetical protein